MSIPYKYTTRFEHPILSCVEGDESFISRASLENLKSLVPQDIDFSENVDLLGVAFNAAVINKFNRNDDGMDSQTAAKVINNFLHKPTNIEHNKSKVVGHIVTAGFSEYEGEGKMIDIEDIENRDDPFNISLGSVIYKYANKEFSELVQRSINPKDSLYQTISTSWEVGFSNFLIAVGSDNLRDAEIVKGSKQLLEMKKKLKAYGGSGRLDDGTKLYRILSGEVYPLGIGFTTNPAADVKGLYSDQQSTKDVVIHDKRDKKTYFDIKKNDLSKKSKAFISQIEACNVKKTKETIMDIEQVLSELKDLLVEKKFSEEAVASMTSTFADAIKQKDVEYRDSLTRAEDEKAAIAKQHEELKASVDKLEKQLGESSAKIAEFESFKKQEEAVARFNSRMEAIDSAYELDEEDRLLLVEDLKALEASEEAFASYQNRLSVMWKHKGKEAKASIDKAIQDKIDEEVSKRIASVSTASTEETKTDKEIAEEALEKAKASEAGMSSSNEESSKQPLTLREKFAGAFSRENITIS